jgi:opacity protein-like surface antigen
MKNLYCIRASIVIHFVIKSTITTLLFGLMGLACADDFTSLSIKESNPPQLTTWKGLYFGGNIGFSEADNHIGSLSDVSHRTPGANNGVGASGGYGGGVGLVGGKSDISDLVAGFHLGYNWQFQNIITGIEGDIDTYGSIDNILGSLRGRMGLGMKRSLIYGTVGAAFISIDGDKSAVLIGGNGGNGGNGGDGLVAGNGGSGGTGTAGCMGGCVLYREGQSEFGFVAGIGAEYQLSSQMNLGIEGLYYKFNEDLVGFEDDFFLLRGRVSFGLGDQATHFSSNDSVAYNNWSGPYVGGHGGVLFSLSDDTIDAVRLVNGENGGNGGNGAAIEPLNGAGGGGGGGGGGATTGFLEEEDIGLLGGIQAGYNWQSDHWIYGIEADASFGDNDRDYLSSLRARFGWTSSTHLFYITGGVAFTRLDGANVIFAGHGGDGEHGSNSVNNGGDGIGGAGGFGGRSVSVSNKEDLTGFAIGVGIDTKIKKNISIGLEGLYYGFNGDDGDSNQFHSMNGSTYASKDDSSTFVLRSRLAIHF